MKKSVVFKSLLFVLIASLASCKFVTGNKNTSSGTTGGFNPTSSVSSVDPYENVYYEAINRGEYNEGTDFYSVESLATFLDIEVNDATAIFNYLELDVEKVYQVYELIKNDQSYLDMLASLELDQTKIDNINNIYNTLYEIDGLKTALDGITTNYTMDTQSYFNVAAVDRVNYIYSTTYVQRKTSLYIKDAKYIYDYNNMVNEGYLTLPEETSVHSFTLPGDNLEDRLSHTLLEEELNETNITKTFEEQYFTMNDLNSDYIDTHGAGVVDKVNYYGWLKIADNRYQCDRKDVIADIASLIVPGFSNGGTYLTYKRVVIEVKEDIIIRLYASPTQSGKMIAEHKDLTNKPNWYMLFAEARIYDVDETTIPSLDTLLTNEK